MPETHQRGVDAAAQMSRTFSTPGCRRRQPPQVGPADHHGAGAQGQRLDHVAAAPHAAVEQDLDLVADGVDDGGQCPIGAGVPSRLLPP